jgi:novobiocin biosynthesis protein NovU
VNDYSCRICASTDHELVLDYGRVALADSFVDSAVAVGEPRFPLTLVYCNGCAHVQIREVIDPELLFRNYVWETGIPSSIGAYCRSFADEVLRKSGVGSGARVVEIASNDGTLLLELKSRGLDVLGVDPARNIAAKAIARGVPTVAEFFNLEIAQSLLASNGPADLIVARNVLAHVADLHGLVEGVRTLLAPDGTAVIECPHLLTLFEQLQYDQVFHEHIGYHSLNSIADVFGRHELRLVDVDAAWVHGGSIRAYLRHAAASETATPEAQAVLAKEAAGILTKAAWATFARRVEDQRRLFREELASLRAAGQKVVGYGASAKGQSMIQFCGIDPSLVTHIADRSAMKIGRFTPGSHIPVVSPEQMRASSPDVVVLFAWNFANEVLAQERALRDRGARFMHPIPVPHYL